MKYESTGDIIQAIFNEVSRAESLHAWPTDLIHQVAVISEEAGESTRASLQAVYEGGTIDDVIGEVIQTAATCIRFLKNV